MKERLTGAIVLVALVVLLVPELLTGPVEPQSREEAKGSSDEPPMRSYTIELAGDSRSATNPEVPGPRTPAPATRPASPQTAESVPQPAAPLAESTAQQLAASASRASRESERETGGRAASTTGAERAGEREAAEAAPAVTGWSVQIGSFASRENADKLVKDLQRQGFRAFITEGRSNGRKLYRVRVGPEPDRAAAQALAARLRKAGQTGAIVPHP